MIKPLHFTCNLALSEHEGLARLFNIYPLIQQLNEIFQQLYVQNQNIAMYESWILWKGQLSFKQYIPPESCRIWYNIIQDGKMQYEVSLVHCLLHSAGNGTAEPVCKGTPFFCDYNISMVGADLKHQMFKLHLAEQMKCSMWHVMLIIAIHNYVAILKSVPHIKLNC